jgi:MFS family permease
MLAKSMFVLSVIGLIDSISYMAVSPSLIFYVLELGGSKEQYGLVMSTFSFASFSAKPIYGVWVDKGGNKFRIPYLSSLAISVTGAILYFLAVQASTPAIAVAMIFVGRFLSGLGAANQAFRRTTRNANPDQYLVEYDENYRYDRRSWH